MFSVYIYDKTFDGLLTAVFDAYFRKTFPDALLSEGDALPLFCDELHTVVTDEEKAGRVWRGLQKKVSSSALGCLTQSWLSELPEVGMLIFRYIRKAIDAPRSIETNFGDPDVLQLAQIWKKAAKNVPSAAFWKRTNCIRCTRSPSTFFHICANCKTSGSQKLVSMDRGASIALRI